MNTYSSVVLRCGLALVFLWFGFSQLSNPAMWVNVLPDWTAAIPISKTAFIYLNGWFEITFGLMLFAGFYTRIVALLLALHLLEITYAMGFNAIGVRDFGLTIATFAVCMQDMSTYSLDMFFSARTTTNS